MQHHNKHSQHERPINLRYRPDTPETSQNPDIADSESSDDDMEEMADNSGQNHDSDRPQNGSFLSLQLSSGLQQMYSLTQELESFRSQERELLRKRVHINRDLDTVRKRQKRIDAQVQEREDSMRSERNAAGISEELWLNYEAFCETLQPGGFKERRSLVWNESYNDSYINYDTTFEVLSSAVGDAYRQGNWRCECVASYTKSGTPIGYQVEYYTLTKSESMTWGTKFSTLYRLAVDAAKKGSVAALEMLVALPDSDSWSGMGWLVEFGFKESRSSHPNPSQRWGFRASHNLLYPTTNKDKRTKLIRAYKLPFEIEEESSNGSPINIKGR